MTTPRLIDLIADYIRGSRSGNTYIEIDEKQKTIRVDGISIGTISEHTIEIANTSEYDGVFKLDARNPNFFGRLGLVLSGILDTYSALYSRQAFRGMKESAWRQDFLKKCREDVRRNNA